MSMIIQPPIHGLLAEFATAIFTISIGIYLEYKKLGRASMVFSVIGLILYIVTTQLDWLTLPLLVIYAFLGVLVAIFKTKRLYGFFGSKMYGSLLFAIAILHVPTIQQQIYTEIFSTVTQQETQGFLVSFYETLILIWFVTAISTWTIGKIVKPKKNK